MHQSALRLIHLRPRGAARLCFATIRYGATLLCQAGYDLPGISSFQYVHLPTVLSATVLSCREFNSHRRRDSTRVDRRVESRRAV